MANHSDREREGEGGLIGLLTGADAPQDGEEDKDPEFPGLIAFWRRNWSQTGDSRESFFRRYSRLHRDYQEAKAREAGNLRTYSTISQAAALSKEFLALLFASCIIATAGLFKSSTGVIIGAMLIAPLMMPILGFALATVWGDRRLLWRSLGTLLIGSALVLIVASTFTTLVPGVEVNSEIRDRTNPNLYDILIAVASGLIGAYAYANPRISSSIAGVAIAVALMPPLCTVGIGLGLGDANVTIGATLLYVSNLLGISLAASFVFWRLRIHPITESHDRVGSRARRNVALTAVLLILVGLPLAYFMQETYTTQKLDKGVREALETNLPDSEFLSLRVRRFGDVYEVRSVVLLAPRTAPKQVRGARDDITSLAPEGTTLSLSLYVLRAGGHLVWEGEKEPRDEGAGTGEVKMAEE